MCLKLTDVPEPKVGTATLYKTYFRVGTSLRSPFYDTQKALITTPGTYIANMSEAYGIDANGIGHHLSRFFNLWKKFPVSKDYLGKHINTSGFHCITTREHAEVYARALGEASFTSHMDTVIVPVIIKTEEIIAVGETPLDFGNDANLMSVPTYVVKSITITPEAYNAAME